MENIIIVAIVIIIIVFLIFKCACLEIECEKTNRELEELKEQFKKENRNLKILLHEKENFILKNTMDKTRKEIIENHIKSFKREIIELKGYKKIRQYGQEYAYYELIDNFEIVEKSDFIEEVYYLDLDKKIFPTRESAELGLLEKVRKEEFVKKELKEKYAKDKTTEEEKNFAGYGLGGIKIINGSVEYRRGKYNHDDVKKEKE